MCSYSKRDVFIAAINYSSYEDAAYDYPELEEQAWHHERLRLLNAPGWEDAPDNTQFRAMSGEGCWYWFTSAPRANDGAWMASSNCSIAYAGEAIFIPAGVDWRQTLEHRPL